MSDKNIFIDEETFSVDEIMAEIKALDMNNQPPETMPDFSEAEDFAEPKKSLAQKNDDKKYGKREENANEAFAEMPQEKPKKTIIFEPKNNKFDQENNEKTLKILKKQEKIDEKENKAEQKQAKTEQKATGFVPKEVPKKHSIQPDYGAEQNYGAQPDYDVEIEENEKEPVPFDFIFEPDEYDMAHNVLVIGKKIKNISRNIVFSTIFLFLSFAVTLLPQLPINLPENLTFAKSPMLYAAVLGGVILCAMLLSADVIKAGVYRLFRLRPTFDTLITVSCIASLAHCFLVATSAQKQLPYTLVPQILLFASMLEKRGRLHMLKRTYKAAMISATPVHVHTDFDDEKQTIVKCIGEAESGSGSIAQPNSTQKFAQIYSPIALAAAIALSVMASTVQKNFVDFFANFAVIMCATVPLGLVFSTVSAGTKITKKLFTSGTALFSYDCAKNFSKAKYAAVSDADIFPQGSVSISGMKVEKNRTLEEVVSSAAAVLGCIEGGVGFAFIDFAKQQYIHVPNAAQVEYHEAGGMSAVINGDKILCGTAAFLMRRGVHITEGLSIKSGVFIAINLSFAGVFALKYSTPPQTYSAFRVLQNGKACPVLASKDFNLTPMMAENKFGLKAGSMEYPPIDERLRLSAGQTENANHKTLALLSRNTMLSFAECITAAKKLCASVRFNLITGTVAAASGMALLYFLTSTNNFAAASPINVALYTLLWQVPTIAYTSLASKY